MVQAVERELIFKSFEFKNHSILCAMIKQNVCNYENLPKQCSGGTTSFTD